MIDNLSDGTYRFLGEDVSKYSERKRSMIRKKNIGFVFQSAESGYLSSIDAEIGQNVAAGKRIGQVDLLDKLKLSAGIDQYYIAKVAAGTKGSFSLEGTSYPVAVQKISFPPIAPRRIQWPIK
jgi:HlyD family secretion protein